MIRLLQSANKCPFDGTYVPSGKHDGKLVCATTAGDGNLSTVVILIGVLVVAIRIAFMVRRRLNG